MTTEPPRVPPRLREAIRNYLENRRSSQPVSIADMRRRVRYAMPELAESDEELGELIAAEIIANHGNVRFDGRSGLPCL